ncbi:MAG: hypothetical protein JWO44_2646 [Bacteroidetes bacterium]|nr:hypothetical protein [Bacteroidota bacterium]
MNDVPIIVATGLTLCYSIQYSDYRDYYYLVLNKLFSLKKKGVFSISVHELQKLIKVREIPLFLIEQILTEMYNYSLLSKWEFQNGEDEYELIL